MQLLDMCRTLTEVTPNSAISHLTAAKLHGLFLSARLQRPLPANVAKAAGGCCPRRKGVMGYRLTLGRGVLVVMGGVPVASAHRTLLDLAELLHWAASRGEGLRKLQQAMQLVRVGAASPPKTHLRLIIARSPLPDFEPNRVLTDASGKPLVQPDLSCERYKTCAEYEGKHHFTPEQQAKDHGRDYLTKDLGWNQVLIS